MTLQRFEFRDLSSGWTLEPMDFSALNLLIGLSGSGKTSILRALMHVVKCGISRYATPWHAEWSLSLEVGGEPYVWSARTAPPERLSGDGRTAAKSRFVMERLVNGAGEVIIERDEARFLFRGEPLPKLTPQDSALGLLKAEEPVGSVCQALGRMRFSWGAMVGSHRVSGFFVGVGSTSTTLAFEEGLEDFAASVSTIAELRTVELPIEALAYLLQRLSLIHI